MIMTPKEQQVASVKTKHMMQLHANAEVEINGQVSLQDSDVACSVSKPPAYH